MEFTPFSWQVFKNRHRYYPYRYVYVHPPQRRYQVGVLEGLLMPISAQRRRGQGLCPICPWRAGLGCALVTTLESHPPGYSFLFPLLRAVTHRRKRGTAQRRRKEG